MNKRPQPEVMTVPEVAQYLHCHPSTIYRLLKRGELPAFKVGSDWRFKAEEIERIARIGKP
jgi:excisionase family DNA binding protein